MMSTRNPVLVTSDHKKGRDATDKFRHAYNNAGLDEARAQRLNENKAFPAALAALIEEHSRLVIPGFEFTKSVELTVPSDYQHGNYLDRLRKTKDPQRYFFNESMTDQNFPKPSHELVPGKTYLIKFFAITRQVTSEECLAVYATEHAHLTGAQGAGMLYEQIRKDLPVNRWTISFDEKDRLWNDAVRCHWVPRVYRYSGVGFGLCLGDFEAPWYGSYVLALFCDLPPVQAADQPSGT